MSLPIINPVQIIQLIGNASQALAIASKLQKKDPNGNKIPEVNEIVAKAGEIVDDLKELNKDCLDIIKLGSGLVSSLDDE